jgi:hypothetical protein
MRNEKTHATKNRNPSSSPSRNRHQRGRTKNAAHLSLIDCSTHQSLDRCAVDWGRAIVPPVAVWSPSAMRAVLRFAGTMGVFRSLGAAGVISMGILGLVVVAVRVFRLTAIGGLVLVAVWLLGLLAIRLLRLLTVWVFVLVLGNIVLAFFVVLVPGALCASLLAHGDCVAEAVEGALLLLAAEKHEVAGLSWV